MPWMCPLIHFVRLAAINWRWPAKILEQFKAIWVAKTFKTLIHTKLAENRFKNFTKVI